MATNAELAAQLLRNAAEFFRSVGEQNSQINDAMRSNAKTYDLVADWVENDALGQPPAAGLDPAEPSKDEA